VPLLAASVLCGASVLTSQGGVLIAQRRLGRHVPAAAPQIAAAAAAAAAAAPPALQTWPRACCVAACTCQGMLLRESPQVLLRGFEAAKATKWCKRGGRIKWFKRGGQSRHSPILVEAVRATNWFEKVDGAGTAQSLGQAVIWHYLPRHHLPRHHLLRQRPVMISPTTTPPPVQGAPSMLHQQAPPGTGT